MSGAAWRGGNFPTRAPRRGAVSMDSADGRRFETIDSMSRLGSLTWQRLWCAAGVVVGFAAELTAFGWGDAREWLPDLAVGWAFLFGGFVLASRRAWSRIGALLM